MDSQELSPQVVFVVGDVDAVTEVDKTVVDSTLRRRHRQLVAWRLPAVEALL